MYTYPDKNDELTIQLIDEISDGTYWTDSENAALDIAVNAVKQTGGKMVDIGCGIGRLFPVFAPYTDSITALEPDKMRYLSACKNAKEITDTSVEVRNCDSSGLDENEKFDIVLSSHVLQHISNEATAGLLSDIKKHTTKNAIVIIMSTNTDKDTDELTIEYFSDGKRSLEHVDEERFRSAFAEEGVLPVRLFAKGSIQKLFAEYGFTECVCVRYFHFYDSGDGQSVQLDDRLNEGNAVGGARDVMYILKKAEENI